MDKEVSKILESIVKFNMSKGNATSRALLGKLRGEIDPQPTYGTPTAIGIDLTRFCEDMSKKHGLKYVKDANGRKARLEV